jgi:hypothetical protein
MAKVKTTYERTPRQKNDRRIGYKAAVTMMRELELSTALCDECALDEIKQGQTKPQFNIVYHYLTKCRARSLDAQAGFCAILSDFVADCSEGFVPDSKAYQKDLKLRMPTRIKIEPATERTRTWKAVQRLTGSTDPMPADWMK